MANGVERTVGVHQMQRNCATFGAVVVGRTFDADTHFLGGRVPDEVAEPFELR